MTSYFFFRLLQNHELKGKQARYFHGQAWNYVFKRLHKPDVPPERVRAILVKKIREGKIKPGIWRVQKQEEYINGGKEFTQNFEFDLEGVW